MVVSYEDLLTRQNSAWKKHLVLQVTVALWCFSLTINTNSHFFELHH